MATLHHLLIRRLISGRMTDSHTACQALLVLHQSLPCLPRHGIVEATRQCIETSPPFQSFTYIGRVPCEFPAFDGRNIVAPCLYLSKKTHQCTRMIGRGAKPSALDKHSLNKAGIKLVQYDVQETVITLTSNTSPREAT